MSSITSAAVILETLNELRTWMNIYDGTLDSKRKENVAQIIKDLILKICSSSIPGDRQQRLSILAHMTSILDKVRTFDFGIADLDEAVGKQIDTLINTKKDAQLSMIESSAVRSPLPDLPTSIPLHVYSVLGTRAMTVSLISTKCLIFSPSETAYKLNGDDSTCQDVDGNEMMIRLNCVEKVNHSLDYALLVIALCCGWNQTGRVIELFCKEEKHGKALVEYFKKLGHVDISVGIKLSDVSGAIK